MNKEDYIKYKENKEFNSIAWEFWLENKLESDFNISKDEFSQKFSQFLANVDGGAINTRNGIKMINSHNIYQKIIGYYEQKFGS